MKLKDWIQKNKLTQQEFAEIVGFNRVHVTLVCSGNRNAGRRFAKCVEDATDGDITFDSMMNGSACGREIAGLKSLSLI